MKWVEQHGSGAVLPRCFETIANATIVPQLEPLLGKRWTRDVATETLQALSVASINDRLGVEVDGAHFGERLAC